MARESYSASEAAQLLGISVDTLRRWDRKGLIKVERDASNRRLVSASEIHRLRRDPADTSLSARNRFRGLVTEISFGGLLAQVELVSIDPLRIVAIITRESAEALGLHQGQHVTAVVKSTSVMVER